MRLTGCLDRLKHILSSFKKPLTSVNKFKVHQTGKTYISRVDTGALVCAIHAEEIVINEDKKIVKFRHDGKLYVEPLLRMKLAKSALGIMNRPRVAWTIEWNGKVYENVEVSLSNRSKLRFKLLIGRNLIGRIGLPVYISDQEVED